MRTLVALMLCAAIVFSMSGCVRTYVFEKERVDQELTGNRGVIMGDVPPPPRKESIPKRTIIGVDVEIPPFTKTEEEPGKEPARKEARATDRELWGNRGYLSSGKPSSAESAYPYRATGLKEELVVEEPTIFLPSKAGREKVRQEEVRYIDYTVKKGDTLSSIAARSDIYGDAGKWKRIFEANKDKLKDPSRLQPGQVLRIPLGGEEKKARGGRIK